MPRLPIFPPPQFPFPSADYLARAELFANAAQKLVDSTGIQPNWPRYFLQSHAIELALKAVTIAFKERSGADPVDPMPQRHDLIGYYQAAVKSGMGALPEIEDELQELAELHETHHARYPKQFRTVTMAAFFDDPTDQILRAADQFVRSYLR